MPGFFRIPALFACSLLFATVLCGQPAFQDTIEAELLQEDFNSLIYALEYSHPDLFAFTDAQRWHEAVDTARRALSKGDTYAGFARRISRLLGMLRDSHTVLEFASLTEYQLAHNQPIMPLRVFSAPEGLYVREDLTGKLSPGTRIVSINGIPADTLYANLLDFSCAEGDSPVGTARVADAIFYQVAGLLIPVQRINEFVVVRPDSSTTDTVAYKALNSAEFDVVQDLIQSRPTKNVNNDFHLDIDRTNGLGVLRIGSFAPPDNRKFNHFLERSFTMLNKENIPNIVIDLRGNTGGSSGNVEELTSYLIEDGYNTPSNIIARQSDLARSRYNRFLMFFTRAAMRVVYRGNEDVQGYMDVMSLKNGEQDTVYFSKPLVKKTKFVFRGKKFLMINGLTASAGVDMTHAFKKHSIGTVVGEPCLGPMTGTFGNPAHFKLFNTGIGLYISTIRYNYDNNFLYERQSITPDIWVVETPEDLRSGRDAALEKVKSLLRQGDQ